MYFERSSLNLKDTSSKKLTSWDTPLYGIDWLSPKPQFLVIILLGVFLPTFSFLRYEDWFSVVWPFQFYNKSTAVLKSCSIYLIITIIFVHSYNKNINKLIKNTFNYEIRRHSFRRGVFICTSIGLSAFILTLYLVGGVGYLLSGASDRTRAFAGLNGVLILTNTLLAVSIVWFVKLAKNRSATSEKIIFFIYFILSTAIIALQGQKSNLFIAISSIAIIFCFKIRRVSLPTIVIGTLTLFTALMVYQLFKQEYLVLGRVVSLGSGEQFWDTVYDYLNKQFFGNFMQLQTMSVLLEGMPIPLEFQYGKTYLSGVLLLVPRSLFPDKPLPTAGIFTEAFWPAMWQEQGTTLPTGLFGEAYMNFGVIGACAMAYIFGSVLGKLHSHAKQNPFDDLSLLYYAVGCASILHFFRGELFSVLYLVLSIALPCRLFVSKIRLNISAK
jgi:oligosaccharide repeat unit polymerase